MNRPRPRLLPVARQSTHDIVALEVVVGLHREVEPLVQRAEAHRLHVDERAGNAPQPELGPQDDAGEPETPDRRAEEVARSRPACKSGAAPSERMRAKRVTWRPKVPATWWFLPCTSLAMAPPTLTNFVPGVVGRNQPCGTAKSMISASVAPASQRMTPFSAIEGDEAAEIAV